MLRPTACRKLVRTVSMDSLDILASVQLVLQVLRPECLHQRLERQVAGQRVPLLLQELTPQRKEHKGNGAVTPANTITTGVVRNKIIYRVSIPFLIWICSQATTDNPLRLVKLMPTRLLKHAYVSIVSSTHNHFPSTHCLTKCL